MLAKDRSRSESSLVVVPSVFQTSSDMAVRLAVLVAVFVVPLSAQAQSLHPSRLALTADARGEVGEGDVAGIDLELVGVGLEWRTTPNLRLRAELLALGATGVADTGRSASHGAGGELSALVVPFPAWRVRPFLRASAGTLFFLRRPFLPGGDFYDFILQAGAGLELPLDDRLALFGDLHVVHLSNGQGLGPFNPAFGGAGGLLGATYALAPRDEPEAPLPVHAPVQEARPNWQPGATVDASIGNFQSSLELAARARVTERLTRRTLAVLDLEAGQLDSLSFVEAGVDLAAHWTGASAGVHGGFRRYAGIDTYVQQVQLEANITDEASVVAVGDWEAPIGFADTYRAAMILRVFPIDTLLTELGGGYQRVGTSPLNDGGTVYFAVEWQLPIHVPAWQVSLFAVRQIDELQFAGLRISWDMGATLRDLARQTGWRRIQ